MTSLETSLLRVPATTAVVLLLVGVVTPMFSWHLGSSRKSPVQDAHLFTAGFTDWRSDWLAKYGEGPTVIIGYNLGALATIAALLVTVAFLFVIPTRRVSEFWTRVGPIATVLTSIGVAWLALLAFTSEGHHTPRIGMALPPAGAFTALVTVFGMRRFWAREA